MAFNRIFQCVGKLDFVGYVVFDVVVIKPIAMIVFADLAILTPQIAASREFFYGAANGYQGFHFRSYKHIAVFVVPHIQRDNT